MGVGQSTSYSLLSLDFHSFTQRRFLDLQTFSGLEFISPKTSHLANKKSKEMDISTWYFIIFPSVFPATTRLFIFPPSLFLSVPPRGMPH